MRPLHVFHNQNTGGNRVRVCERGQVGGACGGTCADKRVLEMLGGVGYFLATAAVGLPRSLLAFGERTYVIHSGADILRPGLDHAKSRDYKS